MAWNQRQTVSRTSGVPTAVEMSWRVGMSALLSVHEIGSRDGDVLHFPVTIEDVRHVYGNYQVQVKPTGGKGVTWVSADRVHLPDET